MALRDELLVEVAERVEELLPDENQEREPLPELKFDRVLFGRLLDEYPPLPGHQEVRRLQSVCLAVCAAGCGAPAAKGGATVAPGAAAAAGGHSRVVEGAIA
jgi:hypothetical protein